MTFLPIVFTHKNVEFVRKKKFIMPTAQLCCHGEARQMKSESSFTFKCHGSSLKTVLKRVLIKLKNSSASLKC